MPSLPLAYRSHRAGRLEPLEGYDLAGRVMVQFERAKIGCSRWMRSRDLALKERTEETARKPLHPMGIPSKG